MTKLTKGLAPNYSKSDLLNTTANMTQYFTNNCTVVKKQLTYNGTLTMIICSLLVLSSKVKNIDHFCSLTVPG